MAWKLWLDDVRTPPSDEWEWAKDMFDVAALMDDHGGYPTEMSLDHDLGDGQTGDWMLHILIIDGIPKTTTVHVHSMNPVGAQRMRDRWNDYVNGGE